MPLSFFFYSLKSLDIFGRACGLWSVGAGHCFFDLHEIAFSFFILSQLFPLSFAFQLRLCWQILQSSFLFFPFRHSDKRTWQRSSWWQEAYIIYILGFLRSSHGHTSVPMLFPFIEVNRISAFISRFSYLRFETFLCWATWHAKRTYEMYAYFFNFTYYIYTSQ